MNRPVSSFPSADEGLRLHLRLRQANAQAPAAICQVFLQPLLDHLAQRYPHDDDHLRTEAAESALLDYLTAPQRFDPQRSDLAAYLRMSARRDLDNLHRRESRHYNQRISFSVVENSEEGGNLEGREEEPSDQLVRDEDAALLQEALHDIESRCTEEERIILRLMLARTDDTVTCAAALGISDQPFAEQEVAVKRIKDRLKKRFQRWRRSA